LQHLLGVGRRKGAERKLARLPVKLPGGEMVRLALERGQPCPREGWRRTRGHGCPRSASVFETRRAMQNSLPLISWETEVWGAEEADQIIHFNGERFLGSYPDVTSAAPFLHFCFPISVFHFSP